MLTSRKAVLRILGVVGIVILLQPFSWTASSKEFPLCIQGCNDARALCDDQCKDDCFALWPSDKPSRDACIAACKAVCLAQSEACKVVCQELKDGGYPPEP